jgi:hypothetical protein
LHINLFLVIPNATLDYNRIERQMSSLDVIQTQPEYEMFRRYFAEKKAPLVIICGSGLSASAGLPTWQKLRTHLEEAATSKVDSLSKLGEQLLVGKLKTASTEENPW